MKISKSQIINYKKNGILKINSIISKKDCDGIIIFKKNIYKIFKNQKYFI